VALAKALGDRLMHARAVTPSARDLLFRDEADASTATALQTVVPRCRRPSLARHRADARTRQRRRPTTSFGGALGAEAATILALMKLANERLCAAKAAGRNRVVGPG